MSSETKIAEIRKILTYTIARAQTDEDLVKVADVILEVALELKRISNE